MRMRSRPAAASSPRSGRWTTSSATKPAQAHARGVRRLRGLNAPTRCLPSLPSADRAGASSKVRHRLRASYQLTDEPVTLETAEQIVRDLMRGAEPRRCASTTSCALCRSTTASTVAISCPDGAPVDRAAAPDRHVSRQAAYLALAARDQREVRQPRPHHRATCDPQDRAVDERRQSAPREIELKLAARLRKARRGLGREPVSPPALANCPLSRQV